MKTILTANRAIITALLLLLSLASCSKKINFLTSPVVPAARGYVKTNIDKNKNWIIQIQLLDLAEVQRLQPSKQTYLIWIVTDDNSAKNIGQIKSSMGKISRQLKASFESVIPFKPTKIFITAEDDPSIRFPGTQVVLSTETF